MARDFLAGLVTTLAFAAIVVAMLVGVFLLVSMTATPGGA
jgi:hypothetical protein